MEKNIFDTGCGKKGHPMKILTRLFTSTMILAQTTLAGYQYIETQCDAEMNAILPQGNILWVGSNAGITSYNRIDSTYIVYNKYAGALAYSGT
jgi:hypothetical protein